MTPMKLAFTILALPEMVSCALGIAKPKSRAAQPKFLKLHDHSMHADHNELHSRGTFYRTFSLAWAPSPIVANQTVLNHAAGMLHGGRNISKEAHSNFTANLTVTTTPAPPESGRAFEIDATSDPRGAWRCLSVRPSNIKGGGRGLFSSCSLKNNTLIGEYRGYRFLMGESGCNKRIAADWAYIWKVPRCLASLSHPSVITRSNKRAAHKCSNDHGYVYIDAKPLDHPLKNPLRFVNGVRWIGSSKDTSGPSVPNVEPFFADDRVWYYTTANIELGDELIVDYGPGYWNDQAGDGTSVPDGIESDWGNFVLDSL